MQSTGASHLLWHAVQSFLEQADGVRVVCELVASHTWTIEGDEKSDVTYEAVLELMKVLQLASRPTFNSDDRTYNAKHVDLCSSLKGVIGEQTSALAHSLVGALDSAFVGESLHKGGESVTNAISKLDENWTACCSSSADSLDIVTAAPTEGGPLLWAAQQVWRACKLNDLKTDRLMVRVDSMKKLAGGIRKQRFSDTAQFQEWALVNEVLELVLGEHTVNTEAYSCAAAELLQSLEFSPEQFSNLVWPLLEKKLDQNVIQEVFLKVCLDGTMPRYVGVTTATSISCSVEPDGTAHSEIETAETAESDSGIETIESGMKSVEITSISDAIADAKEKQAKDYTEAHALNDKRVPLCTGIYCVAMEALRGVLGTNVAAEPFTLRLLESTEWKPFMKNDAAAFATTELGWSAVLQVRLCVYVCVMAEWYLVSV